MSAGAINGMGGLSPLPPATRPAPAAPPSPPATASSGGLAATPSFVDQLQKSNGGVEFSKHALERLQRRGIPTDPTTMARLEHGVDLAAAKNCREAVVMVDNSAFVVSVKNRTVITAIDAAHMRQHVFTNIDSAVVA